MHEPTQSRQGYAAVSREPERATGATLHRGDVSRRWPPVMVRGWRRLREGLTPLFGPLTAALFRSLTADMAKLHWMGRVPPLPSFLRRVKPAPVWPNRGADAVPPELTTVPGVWRDADAERRAAVDQPLHDFGRTHVEGTTSQLYHGWHYVIPTAPKLLRQYPPAVAMWSTAPADVAERLGPEELTAEIRKEAAQLGLSAVGFAPYDPNYTLAEYGGRHEQGSVIVCVLEQDWPATQTAPSARAERAAFTAYGELMERGVALAEFVQRQGYKAQPHNMGGETLVIHYGVEAGLGQLGLNGQLLTPAAGSRCRLMIITTNADLIPSGPVDYGINAICDLCQACIRRCPVGAIPKRRLEHRGVTKAKIKTERCFPVVVGVEGCAICMKVCPVQRYGLDAVRQHLTETGSILGAGSDELEGFSWPLDGRFYGADAKPRVDSQSLLKPDGFSYDPSRTAPVVAEPVQAERLPE
jgi:epoxyqueuosine reductase